MPKGCKLHEGEPAQDLVRVGEIVKLHGIKGEIKVYPYSGQPENFKYYKKIQLQSGTESRTDFFKVTRCRQQGKVAILALEGVTSREAAEPLLGNTVWLLKEDFQRLDPDEYYWHQLEGLLVVTESGRELGKVTGLFRTKAHDIMVVTGRGHEYMIPVKDEIIRKIDERDGRVIISPPAGLLEINK